MALLGGRLAVDKKICLPRGQGPHWKDPGRFIQGTAGRVTSCRQENMLT